MQPDDLQTKTIDNFSGKLTRVINGDLNSGFAKYSTTHSIDPFRFPRNLSWMENPVQIDAAGSVITDLILAGKERVENGVTYVYAIGHTGRFYKIQVNNPNVYTAIYDNPVLLTTLANGQAFTMGGSIDFFNGYVWIGHDSGVTRIDFGGTNETVVSGSWASGVPHLIYPFIGSIFITNGTNIAQIDSTNLVVSSTKLSPGFPTNTTSRDIRTTSDGRYLVVLVTEIAPTSILATTPDTNSLASGKTYVYYWNGTDTAASSITLIPSYLTTSYFTYESFEYMFGYDSRGSSMASPQQKILTLPLNLAPMPNAVYSNGNMIDWCVPTYDSGSLKANIFSFGQYDSENESGFFRRMKLTATSPQTDVVIVPFMLPISNYFLGTSFNTYTNNVVAYGRVYFSTLEYNGTTQKFRFYYHTNVPVGTGTTASGVYETQTQLFSQKQQIKEIRFYIEPAVSNNSWQVDLIGSDGNVISGSTKTFTPSVGTDAVKYNPSIAPTYALGLRITNTGSANWILHKVEIDHSSGGNL